MLLNKLRKLSRFILFQYIKSFNKNKDFTLISNNCIAGLLYHDLGLEFKTPIINMFIKANDYIRLLNDFEFYIDNELNELENNDKDYPIGTIGKDEIMITLHFLHFKDFNQARIKWESRKKKICKDNMFILAEYLPEEGWSNTVLSDFEKIPYNRKKVVISMSLKDEISTNSKNIIYVEGSNFANWKKKTWKIWEKGYDDCKIIDWINSY